MRWAPSTDHGKADQASSRDDTGGWSHYGGMGRSDAQIIEDAARFETDIFRPPERELRLPILVLPQKQAMN